MMLTPHILTGAALASLMPGSAAGKVGAFGIGLVSHYLLDAVPHWERLFGPHYNDELPNDHRKWPNHIIVQGAVDTYVGILLLRYFALHASSSVALCIFLGGMGGFLPDVLDNTPWWSHLTKKVPLWRAIEKLHRKVHMSYNRQRLLPHYTGIVTQLLASCFALLILIKTA